MRSRFSSALLLVGYSCGLSAAGGCHSDPAASVGSAETKVEARADAQRELVTPTLGGSVLALGGQQVELAVLENGLVQALVYDAGGKALVAPELPKLSVVLRTKGGGHPSTALAWVAPHACLEGRAQLEAGLVAEPIEVTLEGAQRVTATLADYAILPLARFGGSVLAVGPYAVELLMKPEMVLAYVLDATGKARGAADLSLQLALGASGSTKLDFKWDPTRAGYSVALDGKLDGSGQPLRLSLSAGGKTYLGAVQSLQGLAAARVDASAQLGAGASAQLEAPAASAQLEAPALAAQLNGSAAPLGDARAKLRASAQTGAATLGKARTSASAKLTAPALKRHKSVSATSSHKSTQAKASAGVKASASFGFGK